MAEEGYREEGVAKAEVEDGGSEASKVMANARKQKTREGRLRRRVRGEASLAP